MKGFAVYGKNLRHIKYRSSVDDAYICYSGTGGKRMDKQDAPDIQQNAPSKAGEVIRLISNAELKADERLKNADLEAKKIVADAKKEAEKITADYAKAADEKIKRVRSLTEDKGKELILSLIEKSRSECEVLKEEARVHVDEAAAAVAEKVLETWR